MTTGGSSGASAAPGGGGGASGSGSSLGGGGGCCAASGKAKANSAMGSIRRNMERVYHSGIMRDRRGLVSKSSLGKNAATGRRVVVSVPRLSRAARPAQRGGRAHRCDLRRAEHAAQAARRLQGRLPRVRVRRARQNLPRRSLRQVQG